VVSFVAALDYSVCQTNKHAIVIRERYPGFWPVRELISCKPKTLRLHLNSKAQKNKYQDGRLQIQYADL